MTLDFPRLSGTVALDLETHDPRLKTHGPGWAFDDAGKVVGYAIAWAEGDQQRYFPVRHEEGRNLNPRQVEAWLEAQLKRSDLTWVFHNRMYDQGWLRKRGMLVRGKCYDTMVMAAMLNEYRWRYNLESCLSEYLGEHKDTQRMVDWAKANKVKDYGSHIWRMPAELVGPYASQDAGGTLRLFHHLMPLIEAEGQRAALEFEMELVPMLIEMRFRGIRVDFDAAEQARKLYLTREAMMAKELKKLVGFDVQINAAASVAKAFDKLGLTYGRTKVSKAPSFTNAFMEKIDHPAVHLIRSIRKTAKTRTTFIEGYVLELAHKGRVHGQFHPIKSDEGGTVTGRFSASNPNLNNLPNPERDEENGRLVRGFFLPEEGALWGALDYSQQEPRLAVHYAARLGVKGGRAAAQRFWDYPDTDFHQLVADLAGIPRKRAKIVNLAIMYGKGGRSLCVDLGLPTKWVPVKRDGVEKMIEVAGEEGEEFLRNYHEKVPFLKGLSDACTQRAKSRGYIKLLDGRRCHFRIGGVEKDYPYKALNRVVQGGSAVQTKRAMLTMWNEGVHILLPVHDEVGGSFAGPDEARAAAKIMETAVELKVPSKVDVDLGPSWGAALKLKED